MPQTMVHMTAMLPISLIVSCHLSQKESVLTFEIARVDSDADGSHRATGGGAFTSGGLSSCPTTGAQDTTGLDSAHHDPTTTRSGLTGIGTHGTHTRTADPRVDADRDRTKNMGDNVNYGGTTSTHHTFTTSPGQNPTSTTGTHHNTGATGLHHPGGTNTTAPGPAPHTAGPHKSDWMNKLDPRVDSDLDGSKTVGGNKTFDAPGGRHA